MRPYPYSTQQCNFSHILLFGDNHRNNSRAVVTTRSSLYKWMQITHDSKTVWFACFSHGVARHKTLELFKFRHVQLENRAVASSVQLPKIKMYANSGHWTCNQLDWSFDGSNHVSCMLADFGISYAVDADQSRLVYVAC
jgi:hypothetical protein